MLFPPRSECKPDAKRKRDSAQPQERAQPSRHERSECKPDAKRKRDSAQPQERAQPSKNVAPKSHFDANRCSQRNICICNNRRRGGHADPSKWPISRPLLFKEGKSPNYDSKRLCL